MARWPRRIASMSRPILCALAGPRGRHPPEPARAGWRAPRRCRRWRGNTGRTVALPMTIRCTADWTIRERRRPRSLALRPKLLEQVTWITLAFFMPPIATTTTWAALAPGLRRRIGFHRSAGRGLADGGAGRRKPRGPPVPLRARRRRGTLPACSSDSSLPHPPRRRHRRWYLVATTSVRHGSTPPNEMSEELVPRLEMRAIGLSPTN